MRFQTNPSLSYDQVKTIITIDKEKGKAHIFTNNLPNFFVLMSSNKVNDYYSLIVRTKAHNVVEEVDGDLELKYLKELESKLEGEIIYE